MGGWLKEFDSTLISPNTWISQVFDLDGTLTDSQPGIYDSLRVMLGHFGIEKTDEELIPFIGPALWESLPKYCGFSHEMCAEAVKVFREHYTTAGIYNNRLYDGVVEMLETLKSAGKHIILATGKPEEQACTVVNHYENSLNKNLLNNRIYHFICQESIFRYSKLNLAL